MTSLLIVPAERGGFAVYNFAYGSGYPNQLFYAGTLDACTAFISEFYINAAAAAVDKERGK